jgi:hypothetical protein
MTTRLLLSLALFALSLHGQLQIFSIDSPPAEEPVTSPLDLGTVPSGDRSEAPLRLRNTGSTVISLERLRVTGTGFSLRGNPSLPQQVSPGTNIDFRVRFEPNGHGSYSGSLRVNDTFIVLLASAAPTITAAVEEGGLWPELTSGDTIVFGAARLDESLERRFLLSNSSRGPLMLDVLGVGGTQFRLVNAPSLPLTLTAGQAVEFRVEFAPDSAGIKQSALTVNNRTFVLEGVGLSPPFSTLEILLDSGAMVSGRQSSVQVRLTEPAPTSGSGTLRMSFVPSDPSVADDPAVLFMNGERSIAMSASKGKSTLLLDGAESARFQTGTTVGEIRFTVELGDSRSEAGVTLPPAAVSIDSGISSKTQTGIDVRVNGFDNTRTVSTVLFQFFDTSGRSLTPDPISVNVANSFRGYFSGTQIGGLFSLSATFPVAGDPSLLGAVEVQFVNVSGPSTTHRIELR